MLLNGSKCTRFCCGERLKANRELAKVLAATFLNCQEGTATTFQELSNNDFVSKEKLFSGICSSEDEKKLEQILIAATCSNCFLLFPHQTGC